MLKIRALIPQGQNTMLAIKVSHIICGDFDAGLSGTSSFERVSSEGVKLLAQKVLGDKGGKAVRIGRLLPGRTRFVGGAAGRPPRLK